MYEPRRFHAGLPIGLPTDSAFTQLINSKLIRVRSAGRGGRPLCSPPFRGFVMKRREKSPNVEPRTADRGNAASKGGGGSRAPPLCRGAEAVRRWAYGALRRRRSPQSPDSRSGQGHAVRLRRVPARRLCRGRTRYLADDLATEGNRRALSSGERPPDRRNHRPPGGPGLSADQPGPRRPSCAPGHSDRGFIRAPSRAFGGHVPAASVDVPRSQLRGPHQPRSGLPQGALREIADPPCPGRPNLWRPTRRSCCFSRAIPESRFSTSSFR